MNQKSDLQIALQERFGEHRVLRVLTDEGKMPLLALDLELKSPITVIMTDGLSHYKMPVPEKYAGREYNELYFCLPSYWEWETLDNENMNWIYTWIHKMSDYVEKNQTWFGHGHTIPTGKNKLSISGTMKQNHFFLCDPILLDEALAPLSFADKQIHFLAIVPIFEDEMDYKQARGAFKLLQKFNSAGVTEKLDDFRSSVLKSKWRFLKR